MSKYMEIVDEALALHDKVRDMVPLSFSTALEIVKIRRMEETNERLRVIAGRIDVLSNVIHENL